jgi:hypothetical protein
MSDHSNNNASPLLLLPSEIRKIIFQYVLKQKGSIALQPPIWTAPAANTNALLAVCNALRDEAIEAYYETNYFLLFVNHEDRTRWDLSGYPIEDGAQQWPLTPSEPWRYPHLIDCISHLSVSIKMPPSHHQVKWHDDFPNQLSRLVHKLDYGRRLVFWRIFLMGAKSTDQRVQPLSSHEEDVLRILAKVQVRGKTEVKVLSCKYNVKESIEKIKLGEMMRVW